MGGEQGWVQMEALERVQDAGCEDVGLNPALCSAPPRWAPGPQRCRVQSCREVLLCGGDSVWKVIFGARSTRGGRGA